MTPWSNWDDCDDKFYKTRTRRAQTEPKYGGRECPHHIDKIKCCEDDCVTTSKKTRTRPRLKQATLKGADCQKLTETDDCDPEDCQLFEEVDNPGPFGDCIEDRHTRKWYKSKQLQVKKRAKYGGKKCPMRIITRECPPVHCELYAAATDPGGYGLCEVGLWQKKSKNKKLGIKTHAVHGGNPCPSHPVITENKCTIPEYLGMFVRECDGQVLIGSSKKVDKSHGVKIQVSWGNTPTATYVQDGNKVQISMTVYNATTEPERLVFEGGGCGSGKYKLRLNLVYGDMLRLHAGSVSDCATTATMEISVEEVCDRSP